MAGTNGAEGKALQPLGWIASSKKDLRKVPRDVQQAIGQALFDAQAGEKHPDAKPLKGFGGAGVLEIVENHDGNTYRAVYTVKFAGIVYVLHVFQKKSKSRLKTPVEEIDKIRKRLKEAEIDYAKWSKNKG